MPDNTYYLRLDDLGGGQSLPLGLEGLPTVNSEGLPIHYRKMRVANCGNDWKHRANGKPIPIPHERVDEWKKNVAALSEAGVRPWVTTKHCFDALGNFVTPDARDTLGYVLRVDREGDETFAVVELHGDEAKNIAAINGRSVGISKRDARDAKGRVYAGETMHHLAICPNPALPDLGAPAKLAASTDLPPKNVPVFEQTQTVAPRHKGCHMTPEIATKARAALSLSADNVSDDKLDDAVAEKALALSAENVTLKSTVTTLTADLATAKTDLTAKGNEVLSLSASLPKAPDALTLSMFVENIEAKREAAITAGAISSADAKAFDAMLADANGTPNVLALSAVGTSKKPFAFQFWDAFAKLGTPIKTGNTLPREARPAAALALSSSTDSQTEGRTEGQKWQEEQLRARGLTAAK